MRWHYGNCENAKSWRKAVVTYMKVLFQHPPGETEENCEKYVHVVVSKLSTFGLSATQMKL